MMIPEQINLINHSPKRNMSLNFCYDPWPKRKHDQFKHEKTNGKTAVQVIEFSKSAKQ